MSRITLIRHGESAFSLSGVVRADDFNDITESYDSCGIVGVPPLDAVAMSREHGCVVCSDLARSHDSATALGIDEIHVSDKLFNEIAIPHFSNGSLALPTGLWLILLRGLWLFGFSKNGESFANAHRRAGQAACRLMELSDEYGSVLLVGHGFFNYFIARKLRARGWVGPKKPGGGFWEYGTYRRHPGSFRE